jgi:hypothetical protein
MTLEEFFTTLGKFVAYLGAASVVLLGLSSWIGTLLSNRIIERAKSELQKDLESYKASLRKSEFLFEKQYEAASEFIAMRQGFLPAHRPDMDWHEAREDMAMHFERIAKSLKTFVSKHGAVMSSETVKSLTQCIGLAEEHRYGVHGDVVSREASEAADTIWNKLGEVEGKLRDAVWDQSGVKPS